MKHLKKKVSLVLTAGVIFGMAGCGSQEQKKPLNSISNQQQKPEKKEKITVNMEALRLMRKGEKFELRNADKDTVYELNIGRVQESMPGITTISANIGDKETAQASLIIRDGKISGMLKFYKEQSTYEVGYDSTLGYHYMRKMAPERENQIEGSKPLVPEPKTRGN